MLRSIAFLLIYFAGLPLTFVTPFAGGLLWVWISIMNPHRQLWGWFSLNYGLIIVLAMGLSMLLSRERKLPASTVVSWAMAAMMVTISISFMVGVSNYRSYDRWDMGVKGLLLSLIMLALTTSKIRVHALVWTFAISLGYFGAKGGFSSVLSGGSAMVLGPPASMIADNNHLAAALAMAIPLMIYLAMQSDMTIIRLGCWIMAALSTIGAVFTYSRGGALALVAVAFMLWLRSSQKLVIACVIAGVAILVAITAPDALWERIGTIQNYEADGSAMGRLTIWSVSLQLWIKSPIFGWGFHATNMREVVSLVDASVSPRAVHNSFIEVLVEAGGVAFVLHMTLLISSFVYSQRVRRLTFGKTEWRWAYDLASMLQVSLTAYCVGGSFLSLGFYDGWWFLVVIAASLSQIVKLNLAAEQRPGLTPIRTNTLRDYGVGSVKTFRT